MLIFFVKLKIAAIILFLSSFASAEDQRIYLDAGQLKGQAIGKFMAWTQGDLSIKQIESGQNLDSFQLGQDALINHNYTFDTYWYRFAIRNDQGSSTVYLHDPQNFYDVFQVFVDGEMIGNLDVTMPLQKRIVAIPLKGNGLTVVYIKKNSNGLIHQSNWSLWSDLNDLKDHIHNSEKIFVVLMTIYGMSMIFTLLALLSFREQVYLHYAGYLASLTIFLINTWSAVYVPGITEYGPIATTIGGLFGSLFILKFLDLEIKSARMTKIVKVVAIGFAVCFAMYFINKAVSMVLTSLISISIAFIALSYAMVRYYKTNEDHVLIFIVAYGTFLLCVVVQVFSWMVFNFLESNHVIFYGMAAENIFMLVAMGNKINQTVKEKLQFNKNMKHSYDQLAKVFYPHQLRFMENGGQLEDSMPLGKGKACVICFDIAGSSKIEGLNTKEFFREVFSECGAIMNANYSTLELSCNAFRVKEMGDGFICSVGYPFKSPSDNIYKTAIELSSHFISAFCHIVDNHDPEQPIYCSIGIAEGEVEAFYSESKPIEYDLYGKGIILATRYEQMRKSVLKNLGENGNIVILQKEVHDGLSEHDKFAFQKLYLTNKSLSIRDNEEAECLYYRLVDQTDGLQISA